jgi:hypothetical protein
MYCLICRANSSALSKILLKTIFNSKICEGNNLFSKNKFWNCACVKITACVKIKNMTDTNDHVTSDIRQF